MARVFNFSAGPAALPLEVLEQIQADIPEWLDTGMTVMELSHRSKEFIGVAEQAEADLQPGGDDDADEDAQDPGEDQPSPPCALARRCGRALCAGSHAVEV